MRFTLVQAALFRNEISFVHMAPTEARRDRAKSDFMDELHRMGTYYTATNNIVYRPVDKSFARFMVCQITGEASDHAPIMFVDGKKSEFKDQRAYDEARWIPSTINGIGPMVVR